MTPETRSAVSATLTLPCLFCGTWNRVIADRVLDRPKCGECAKPMLLDRPFPLTDATFDRVVKEAGIPVVVDFYADWCGPCKIMAPDMDAFAARHAGTYFAAKLDTDRSPLTAQRFAVRSIPTVIRFERGAKTAERAGAMRLAEIEAFAGV